MTITSRAQIGSWLRRILLASILLFLPLATAWNLFAGTFSQMPALAIGAPLSGVTNDIPLDWSFAALVDGRLQKAISARVAAAIPLRPFLVRLDNQIQYTAFGQSRAVIKGRNGQLTEYGYINEYCQRRDDLAADLASKMIPVLRDIQNFYRARGAVFLYLITPSKVAHLPDDFVDDATCRSSKTARTRLIPDYVERLRAAGLDVLDTATLVHNLKGRDAVDVFPQGGVHWNALGAAQATSAMIAAVNAGAHREVIPPFDFSSTIADMPHGSDRDLTDLANLLFPSLDYPTPKVAFRPSVSCEGNAAQTVDIAIVGNSFMHMPVEYLVRHSCLARLTLYYYFKRGRFGGNPYRGTLSDLQPAELAPLRDARVLLLEENETAINSDYARAFHDYLMK